MADFRRLSKDELRALCGRVRRDCVARWFSEAGWIFETDANGWPIVSAAYAEARLSGRGAPLMGVTEPDFTWFDKAA